MEAYHGSTLPTWAEWYNTSEPSVAGASLAKVDIESAYRLIPVYPQNRPLQAIQWEGKVSPSGFAQPPRSSMQSLMD